MSGSNMPAPDGLQMPAPSYGGATDEALSTDLAAELDDDAIIDKYHTTQAENQNVAVQQVIARERANQAKYEKEIGELRNQNNELSQTTARLDGALSAMQNQQQSTLAQNNHQQAMAQFALTPDEEAAHGEALPVMQKAIQAALYEQNLKHEQQMSEMRSQLEQATGQLTSTREEVEAVNSWKANQEAMAQSQTERRIDAEMSRRSINMAAFLEDPDMLALATQKPPGSPYSHFQMFKHNNDNGNVEGMMEFVDMVLKSKGFDPLENAQVPSGNTPRVTTNEEAAHKQQFDQWLEELETIENANSIGDYSKFGGSKSKFLERRNELMRKLEENPLPE